MLIGLARIVARSCASIRDCAALAGRAAVPALLAASAAGAATTPSTPAPAPAETSAAAPAATTGWVHAYAAFGTPKYPRNFTHFEYLNPEAPKSGTLYLRNPDRRTSFDKLNPYTIKGNAPAGVAIFMFETLAVRSAPTNRSTMYGLLAEEMLVAPDKISITFRLNPKARFSNGDPVTSRRRQVFVRHADQPVRFARLPHRLAGVERAVGRRRTTIRFDLKDKTSDQIFKLARLPVFSHK